MTERTPNQELVNKGCGLKFTITGVTMGHLFNLSISVFNFRWN